MFKRKLVKMLPSIIFFIIETALIFIVSAILQNSFIETLSVIIVFITSRLFIGKSKHYKSPLKCLLWSTTVVVSLVLVWQISLIIGFFSIVLAALFISERADLNDTYQYSSNIETKHKLQKITNKAEFNKIVDKVALSSEQRQLLNLYYLQKLNLQLISEKLNIEYSTAKKYHSQALNILSSELATI